MKLLLRNYYGRKLGLHLMPSMTKDLFRFPKQEERHPMNSINQGSHIVTWYGYAGQYKRMHLLYAARVSYGYCYGSSGHLEQVLISRFRQSSSGHEDPGSFLCENKRGGGDSASPHRPHYCYVVERFS